ncbi:hypothetical protein [Peribacillus butanolivorans]
MKPLDSIEFKGFSIRGKDDRRNTVSRQTTASSEEIGIVDGGTSGFSH